MELKGGVAYDDCRGAMDYECENWIISEENILAPLSVWQNTALFLPIWDT
jgi:hypothetical protein